MLQMLKGILSSKKHTMTLVGVIVVLGQEFGLPISEEAVLQVCGLIAVCVGATAVGELNKNRPEPTPLVIPLPETPPSKDK